MSERLNDEKTATAHTATIELTFEVFPRPGQNLTDATAELTQNVISHMANEHGSLFEVFGARAEDLDDPGFTGWGGYEGPFMLSPRARPVNGDAHEST